MELGQEAEGRSLQVYPSLMGYPGERGSIQPHNFKTLRTVGTENPGLKGYIREGDPEPGRGWKQRPGVRWADNSESRVHTGIHTRPLPQRLHRGQAQAIGGVSAPAPSESSSSLKGDGGCQSQMLSLSLSSAPEGVRGGAAGRALGGLTGRPVTWGSPICSPGWTGACCSRGCWRPVRGSC